MAASGRSLCVCTCRFLRTIQRHPLQSLRYCSVQVDQEYYERNNSEKQNVRRKKKRDPHAVLKALSSTVQKVPGAPEIGFFEDAYLTPRSDYTKREYLAALESGRNAAEFVIKKYPDLCKLREPVPAWPDEYRVFEELEDEPTLNYLIESNNVDAAVTLFDTLKTKDVAMSLETMNAFLDLVGFHGVGLNEAGSEEQASNETSSSSDSDSDSSSSDEDGDSGVDSSNEKGGRKHGFKTKFLLSENSYAAKIFSSMDVKNAQTYEAYILALLKHGEFQVACQIFDQMREDGHKGSTFLFNQLLTNLKTSQDHPSWNEKWEMAEDFINKMKNDASCRPDIGTYNALLELAAKLEGKAPMKAGMLLREMVANGIEPSLGSYLLVMEANDHKKSEKYGVLVDVVKKVDKHEGGFVAYHPKDTEFFSVGMNLARGYSDAHIAKKLYNIAKRNGNFGLLATTTSPFLGNYLCALARAENDIEFLFQEYDRIVPNEVVPRDWVFTELFRRLENGGKPERIMSLCRDMRNNRVRLSFPVCERIFAAFGSEMPAEMYPECLDTALSMMKWMAMFDIPTTSLILGQVARLYALNNLLDDAWKTIKLFEDKNIRPNFTMMCTILEKAVENGDESFVFKSLKKMAEYGYWITEKQKQNILESLNVEDNKREKLEMLIGKM